MKVLMISGDTNLLTAGTEANARLLLQRKTVEQLDVFVWPARHSRREILKAARTTAYDVVTTQDPFWRGLIALRAARLAHAKLNVQLHADPKSISFLKRILMRIVLSQAGSMRVVSELQEAWLRKRGVTVPIHLLPVFIDLAPFRNLPRRHHPRYFRTILWIGRFEEEKRPQVALETLAAARAAGIDACLIMLGDGSLRAALERAAHNYKKCVEFPGWQSPAPYLSMADVVISTSAYESYGASIVEALAAGVPVVSPDYGVAREAGATVVPRDKFIDATLSVLRSGGRASLRLAVPTAQEWVERWRQSLI